MCLLCPCCLFIYLLAFCTCCIFLLFPSFLPSIHQSVAPLTRLTQNNQATVVTCFLREHTHIHAGTLKHSRRWQWWQQLTWVCVCLCVMWPPPPWQAGIWRGPALVLSTNPFQGPAHLLLLPTTFLSLQAVQPPVLLIRHRPQFDAQDW